MNIVNMKHKFKASTQTIYIYIHTYVCMYIDQFHIGLHFIEVWIDWQTNGLIYQLIHRIPSEDAECWFLGLSHSKPC